jgi:hypothetical protein
MNKKTQEILAKFVIGRNEIFLSHFCKDNKISRNGLYSMLDRLQEAGYLTYSKDSVYGRKDNIRVQTVIYKMKNA